MSYEGYSQFLCPTGHHWTLDCNCIFSSLEENSCPVCHMGAVCENTVDLTNGSFDGDERIDGYIKLEEASRRECKECHSVLEITYKIPRKRGAS